MYLRNELSRYKTDWAGSVQTPKQAFVSTMVNFWVLCQKDLCFVRPLEIITVLSNVNI